MKTKKCEKNLRLITFQNGLTTTVQMMRMSFKLRWSRFENEGRKEGRNTLGFLRACLLLAAILFVFFSFLFRVYFVDVTLI